MYAMYQQIATFEKMKPLQSLIKPPQKIITKTIWVLSLMSLFNDMASEMLYPVMPLFLKHIGYTAIFIGVLEGIAEAVAGLSKSYFGKLSDNSGKRLPFVQLGYALSAISKPMLAIFIYPSWIFLSITTDRLGKGIRTGARDAMLSEESSKDTKAQVFGFHKSMETMGAVLGPTLALIYLYYFPNNYTSLFLIAFFPGLLAFVSTFFIKTNSPPNILKTGNQNASIHIFSFISYWKNSNRAYKKLIVGLLLFALFNSSDVFLLLKMKESGLNDSAVIGIYIFYNLIYALLAYPIGILADKLGLKKIFIVGLFIFSIVYFGFAFNHNITTYLFLFFLYGVYAAATEGVAKAWISNLVDKKEIATAIGTFAGFQSISLLIASSICGLLWFYYGAMFTFLLTAIITTLVVIYLAIFSKTTEHIS